ncbi:DUF6236 family protein [Pseudomonas sp. KCJK8670]|uniref:DUF6236 family protein n=1 Tax=Pseudomonas sp. KCJK8670 TaxID=3344558 RepID=UPI0039062040
MGQAKYRKMHDPDYGKPVKLRGLILSLPMSAEGNTLTLKQDFLDPQDLRSSLMYWDRLSWPESNVMGSPTYGDVEFLKSAGVLERPKIIFQGRADFAQVILGLQNAALMNYERTAPGIWSLSQGANSVENRSVVAPEPGTLVKLLNAVPVPAEEVPLEEILRFKAKRRDELLAFRDHFEELVSRVSANPDPDEELRRVLKEVDQACSDLVKTTREWQFPVKLTSTEASLNFSIENAIRAGREAYDAIKLSPLALSQTATAVAVGGAALLSQIEFKPGLSYRGLKRPRSPYRYAYHVERDLT